MAKQSILKRASYVGVALILTLTAMPAWPFTAENVWADEPECVASHNDNGEATYNLLNNKLSATADDVELTLCAGSDFSNYPWGISAANIKNLTLHLNGNTLRIASTNVKDGQTRIIDGGTIISTNDNTVFNNSGTIKLRNVVYNGSSNSYKFVRNKTSNAKLIIESGDYSNTGQLFWKEAADSKFEFTGGTFDRDVNDLLPADFGYKAYFNESDRKWHVETKLTTDNFTINPTEITIKEGEVVDLLQYVSKPNDSTNTKYITGTGGSTLNEYVQMTDGKAASNNVTTIVGKKVTTQPVRVTIAPKYDKTVKQTFKVSVVSGLGDVAVDSSVDMLQEDIKTLDITNVISDDADEAVVLENGISYSVSSENEKIKAEIVDGQVKITTGENGKIEDGAYDDVITLKATHGTQEIEKKISVNVGKIFTNFKAAEQDANKELNIKENEDLTLHVGSVKTMVSTDNVEIVKIEFKGNDSDLMEIKGADTISGLKNGAGTAKINVTARYTSPNGNTYDFTRLYKVNISSALESIGVRKAAEVEANDYSGNRYGNDVGETNEFVMDKNDTESFRVTKHTADAAAEYEITSSDTSIAEVIYDQTGKFSIEGKEKGTATITVKVTAKGDANKTFEKIFTVTINPILEEVTAEDVSVDQGNASRIVPSVNDDVAVEYTYSVKSGDMGIINLNTDGSFTTEVGNGKSGEVKVEVIATETGERHRTQSTEVTVTVNPVFTDFTVDFGSQFDFDPAVYKLTIYEQDAPEIDIKDIVNEKILKGNIDWSYEITSGADLIELDGTKITAKKDGEVKIIVTGKFISAGGNEYNKSKTIDITIKPLLARVRIRDAGTKVTLNGSTQELYELDEVTYKITHENKNAPVTYRAESADESIATVEVAGDELKVTTYEKTEDVIITVYAKDNETGKEVSARMTVRVKPTLKTLNVEDVYLKVDDKETLNITWGNPVINPEIEYHIANKRIAIKTRDNGVKGMKAGETEATVKASYDGKTIEKTIGVHVYEMVKPRKTTYYGKVGDTFEIDVHDKNENAEITTTVIPMSMLGFGGLDINGSEVKANRAGRYMVWYMDRMANGEIVGFYAATINVYALDTWAQESTIVRAGEHYDYGINVFNTVGEVETIVTRDGEEIAKTKQIYFPINIDTTTEGKYEITITNLSAKRHDVDIPAVTYYFYVMNPVETEEIFTRKGETATISTESSWTVDMTVNMKTGEEYSTDIVEFDTSDMELGEYIFRMAHTFETGEREEVKVAAVVVYDVVGDETDDMVNDEDRKSVADFVSGKIGTMLANDSTDDEQVDIYMDIDELKDLLRDGIEIETRLEVALIDEENWEYAEAYNEVVLKIEDESGIVAMYEVYLVIYADGEEIGLVYELDDAITLKLEIPEEYRSAADGYTRTFTVVRGHQAMDYSETADKMAPVREGNYLVFKNKKFSSFAISYQDVLNPVPISPDTGKNTNVAGSASANVAVAIAGALAAVTLAGAAVFVKRK